MLDETGQAALVDLARPGAVEVRGLHGDPQGARDHAAHVEKAEATFELFVGLYGGLGDTGVEQNDGVCSLPGGGCPYDFGQGVVGVGGW